MAEKHDRTHVFEIIEAWARSAIFAAVLFSFYRHFAPYDLPLDFRATNSGIVSRRLMQLPAIICSNNRHTLRTMTKSPSP